MPPAPDAEFLALQEALIGRYALAKEIGRGGMGIVYLAHEVALDRPVALKLLPPAFAAVPAFRERFLREARTAAKLSHPHIVPIHAVDEVRDFVFFAMAYVEGESLGARIRNRGPLPVSEATRILREVAWALAYGHAQGVIHRDVKPDNILLETGTGRALLTDFGIAQVRSGAGLTGAGEILGTAEFMSPEQAAGDAVDARSDLYSLAVVGHYMLSGRLPFQGETVSATLAQHITQPAPPLATVVPEVPRALAILVDRCLNKDPARRFADGEELVNALSRALELRRDIPVALRVFVEHNRERLRGLPLVLGLATVYFGYSLVAFFELGPPVLVMTFIALLLGGAPVGMLLRMARELQRSGYSHPELLAALKEDLETRREQAAFERGVKQTWVDRLGLGLMIGGLTAATAGTAALLVLDLPSPSAALNALGVLTFLGAGAAVVGAPIAVTRSGKRRGLPGARWLKFWKSRIGKLLFKVAGFRLRRVGGEGAADRPTEMAIGMAADRLYEELPKGVRQEFAELPGVVRKLEEDAQAMRARVTELDELLYRLDRDGRQAGSVDRVGEKRSALAADLERTRDAAKRHQVDAVAALETIRLELLRLHAGAGSVESLTADLGAAQALSEQIGHMCVGLREVEQLLEPGARRSED